jgi:uncharacterized protein YceK
MEKSTKIPKKGMDPVKIDPFPQNGRPDGVSVSLLDFPLSAIMDFLFGPFPRRL